MTVQEVQLSIEVLLLAGMLYMIFYKSYLKQKGKNLATKQDVEEITKLAETIKSELAFSTQSMITLKKEERESIVQCYEKLNNWLLSMYEIEWNRYSKLEGREDGEEYKKVLRKNMSDFVASQSRMEVFTENDKLHEGFKNQFKIANRYYNHIVETFDRVRIYLREEELRGRKIRNDLTELTAKHYVIKKEHLDEFAPEEKHLQATIREHLRSTNL